MEDKELKIKELEDKRNELWNKIHDINSEITQIELDGCNYEGKFIDMPEYGWMYVTWQKLDKSHNIYNEDVMFFQGFMIRGSSSHYRDDFWIDMDAMQEWNINIDTFTRYVKENRIKILTKEEFVKEMHNQIEHFYDKVDAMLDECIKCYEDKSNDE